MRGIHRWTSGFTIALLFASNAGATSVPSLTFEELADHSELILAGEITRSWQSWDSEHKFIWTHHELRVSSAQKGSPGSTVVVSEPGGVIGERGMAIAGSVEFRPGDRVAVFLQRMPNGYLRTTGWGQGKYTVDQTGHLHAETSLRGIEVVKSLTIAGTSLRTLDGISLPELRAWVAARVTVPRAGSKK
jgi:hypothetical protein